MTLLNLLLLGATLAALVKPRYTRAQCSALTSSAEVSARMFPLLLLVRAWRLRLRRRGRATPLGHLVRKRCCCRQVPLPRVSVPNATQSGWILRREYFVRMFFASTAWSSNGVGLEPTSETTTGPPRISPDSSKHKPCHTTSAPCWTFPSRASARFFSVSPSSDDSPLRLVSGCHQQLRVVFSSSIIFAISPGPPLALYLTNQDWAPETTIQQNPEMKCQEIPPPAGA